MKTERFNWFQIPFVLLLALFSLLMIGSQNKSESRYTWIWHYNIVPAVAGMDNGLPDPHATDYGPHDQPGEIFTSMVWPVVYSRSSKWERPITP